MSGAEALGAGDDGGSASSEPRGGVPAGLALVGFVLLCFAAAAVGALTPPGAWYRELVKPSWNPPAWVFGPVWTALYLAMAVAAWRVWRRGEARRELGLFTAQLALNAAWSPLFFGLQRPGVALVEIVFLLGAVCVTGLAFGRRDRVAGGLFVPYALWVGFATVLNATLWWLNR